MRADPVTTDTRWTVLRRDGGCVALTLGAPGTCRNSLGYPQPSNALYGLELDHVKSEPMMGKRAPSDPAHLVTLCHVHHQGGWATRNRPLLRRYLHFVSNGMESTTAARQVLAEHRAATGQAQT
jgi:hypothetical protein